METILAVILVIGSIGAVAQGQTTQGNTDKCVEKVRDAYNSEDAQAVIEICFEPASRVAIVKCKTKQCVREVIQL